MNLLNSFGLGKSLDNGQGQDQGQDQGQEEGRRSGADAADDPGPDTGPHLGLICAMMARPPHVEGVAHTQVPSHLQRQFSGDPRFLHLLGLGGE